MARWRSLWNKQPPLAPMVGGEGSPLARADLEGLAKQVLEMRQAIEQLQVAMQSMYRAGHRAPVHMEVEHLEVERLEFNIDSIDVDELGGELNIGLTSMFKPGGPKGGKEQKNGKEPKIGHCQPGGMNGQREQKARGALPGSVVSRWLQGGTPAPHGKPEARPIWPPPEREGQQQA